MQKRKAVAPVRWSYSAWSTWKTCAYKYGQQYIHGLRQPSNYYSDRGNEIHKKLENTLNGKITSTPYELSAFTKEIRELKKLPIVVEQFWGVDRQWQQKDRDSWCVMKMDVAVPPVKQTDMELCIIDLKTGREYPDHESQGSLYAAIGMVRYPKTKLAHVEFWYADGAYSTTIRYTRAQIVVLQEYWRREGERLMAEKRFLPSPSELGCKYCHLRTDKGGTCSAWEKL